MYEKEGKRGGTLTFDDFHGPIEWANLERQMKRVFPDRDPVELEPPHPIYSCFYNLAAYPQVSVALQEATEIDHRYGRIMNPNLQHYHVPVNADIHAIETLFVEEDDTIVNPLGVKGMGELGMVGIPAAIANAVFHATGRRIRELPITPDKLL